MNLTDLIQKALDSICVLNSNNQIIFLNPAFSELTGYSETDLLNADFSILLPGDVAPNHKNLMQNYIKNENKESTVLGQVRKLQIIHKSGEAIPIELKAFEISPDPDHGRVFAGIIRDLRDREIVYNELNRLLYDLDKLGFIDPISKLPNEKFIYSRFEDIIKNSKELRESVYAIINIDDLELINSKFSREVGDQIIFKIARELQMGIRVKDYLGRLDNGNFACLFPNTSLSDVIHLLDNLRLQLSRKKGFFDSHISGPVSISIGCSRIMFPAKLIEDYSRESNQALNRAKSEGKNKLLVYGFY
jgi:diguanylate cyclase (GGDEF)-like protein/PAS domain S-box-containing protein